MPNFSGFDKNMVKLPGRSGYDMSHSNFFTATCGTLTPCLLDWVNPGDKIRLSCDNLQVQLPPMASDFYGFIEAKVECFFVPNRVLYGGWQDVVAPPLTGVSDGSPSFLQSKLPRFIVDSTCENPSLREYLSLRARGNSSNGHYFDIFPFLAYHKICDDWYKDLRLQKPAFLHPSVTAATNLDVFSLPWIRLETALSYGSFSEFYDGVPLTSLRQRLWSKDLFTNSTYEPQVGDASSVEVEDGKFTIASLRSANALQQYLERNNIAGNSYQDRIKAHFGVYPADAVVDRSIYLGRFSVPVYTKGVYQASQPSESVSTSNPMNSVGSKYGSSQAVGRGSLVDSFTATEHGILMCLYSLVPKRSYSSGTRRQWFNVSFEDYPDPILASVGDEEIFLSQLADNGVGISNLEDYVFGYTQRYSSYKFVPDEVHGLLNGNLSGSLKSFCLQDYYNFMGDSDDVFLGSEFVEIPIDYLDGVTAVNGDVSKFGCWVDSHWNYKKVSTLPAFSIPTLENLPLDGHYEVLNSGGYRL